MKYKVVCRITGEKYVIGYIIECEQGNKYKVSKDRAIQLAKNKDLLNVKYNTTRNSLKGIDCDLRHMETIKRCQIEMYMQRDIQNKIDEIRKKSLMLGVDPNRQLYKYLVLKNTKVVKVLELVKNNQKYDIKYKSAGDAINNKELSIYVTSMEGLFKDYYSVDVDFSKFNTHNVTSMKSMFERCSIPIIRVSKFDTDNVDDMSSMFEKCKAKVIDISGFKLMDIKNKDRMMYEFKGKIIKQNR